MAVEPRKHQERNSEFDVAFYEAFEEEEAELKRLLPPSLNCRFTWKTIQESGDEEPPAKIISTRTQSIYPESWSDSLEAIITRSTGYDHVREYLRKLGRHNLRTAYLPEYAARAVAEQALLLWSALLRKLNEQQTQMRTFHRDGLTGSEIRGRTLTVIGVGRIGSQIVEIGMGLGMAVLGVDIKPNETLRQSRGLRYASLEEGLRAADIAVCALPLTSLTRGMLNSGTLELMPRGSIFVNVARGEVSPAEDLLELLRSGALGGVGLDVYDNERELASILREGASTSSFPPKRREGLDAILALLEHPRAVLTPHNAFNTKEAVERKSKETVDNLTAYLNQGKFLTPVPQNDE